MQFNATPEWLFDDKAAFALNMNRVVYVTIQEKTLPVADSDEDMKQYFFEFHLDNGDVFVPPIAYSTKENIISAMGSMVDDLVKSFKRVLADAIGDGMFRRDVLLNNAVVKASQKVKESEEKKETDTKTEVKAEETGE